MSAESEFSTPQGGAIRLTPEEAAKRGRQGFDLAAHLDSLTADVAPPASCRRPGYYAIFGYKDQGSTGSCTGCTAAAMIEFRGWMQDPAQTNPLSAGYIYWRERYPWGIAYDNGANVDSGLRAAMTDGICRDALWPDAQVLRNNSYVQPNVFTAPSAAADAEAPENLVLQYVYVGEGTEPGMQNKMMTLLAAGYPLGIAIGNHAVALIEYDDGTVWGPNSHGPQPTYPNDGRIGIGWNHLSEVMNIFALMSVRLPGSVALKPQTVSIAPIADQAFEPGVVVPISAAATSGLPVTITSLTPSVCTVIDATHAGQVGWGTCTLRATQGGDAVYAPAPPVDRSFGLVLAQPPGTDNAAVLQTIIQQLNSWTANMVTQTQIDALKTQVNLLVADPNPNPNPNPNPPPTALVNGGFETPSISGFQYTPTGATWVFTGGAGISGNGSGFTGGNPSAPEGMQVGIIQGAGSKIEQTVTLTAGSHTLSFKAAQRGNWQQGTQIVNVLVDGAKVGSFQPPDKNYAAYTTPAFTVTAGPHVIALVGAGSGSDFTAFVDDVKLS